MYYRLLIALCLLAAPVLQAGTITQITITGFGNPGFVQWDTPPAGDVSDLWVEAATPLPYASNPATLSPGTSGTIALRMEGFGGFSVLNMPHYQLDIVYGAEVLQLTCTIDSGACTYSASPTPFFGGLSISNFGIIFDETDKVAAFATGAAPGTGPNVGNDLIATFDYTTERVADVPEPATLALSAAGLAALALLRRR